MNAKDEVSALKKEYALDEKSELEWKINLIDSSCIHTPVFAPMTKADTKFLFDIWFQRNAISSANETTKLNITLKKLCKPSVQFDVRFNLSVLVHYKNGSLYKDYQPDIPFELEKFSKVICIDVVSNVYVPNSNTFTTHGLYMKFSNTENPYLTLKCRMNFFGHIVSPSSFYNEMDALHNLRCFTKNFDALYQSNELSDVSIQIGEKTFKSHKFVLSAHSPVFKKMLVQDFQEAKTGVIAISDIEPEVFESFLKFLYVGEVEDKSFSNINQLYSIADKYDVQIFKQEYSKILADSNLNEDQINDVFQLAYLCNDENLQKLAKQLLLSTINKERY